MNSKKNNEKFAELADVSDVSNADTKINIDTAREEASLQKQNFFLKLRYAIDSLPKIYKGMALLAILNTFFIILYFIFSWN
jgi:hypothetical protein